MSTSPPLIVADRYRLVAPLGQGGMGRVWRAADVVLHRDVAIKELVPPPGLTVEERQEMRERSLREARAIARLNNVNVVRVFDVLRTDADPWIVMEYVPSRSLQDALATDGPFGPVRVAEIGLGVLNALRAAHRAGVVHRDVKPGNVLIGEDGRVVLTDFGLATVPGDPNVTRTGLVLGSPAYIAPERARDGTAGPGADLWSLGATLYAAVEGTSPFARPTAIATLAALATENPPPARNAGPLKPVLNGLLRKDPAHRINADEAERLLLRATGKRSKLSFPMSPTMRRPGVGRERPALTSTPPVVPGAAPVVPGPRPPVTPARPGLFPPPAAGGEGRPTVFAPGKATVGRPASDTPTRIDGPKLDATRLDTPAIKDQPLSGTRAPSPQPAPSAAPPPAPAPDPAAQAASPGLQRALAKDARGVFGTLSAAEIAAHRKRTRQTPPESLLTSPGEAFRAEQPVAPPAEAAPAASALAPPTDAAVGASSSSSPPSTDAAAAASSAPSSSAPSAEAAVAEASSADRQPHSDGARVSAASLDSGKSAPVEAGPRHPGRQRRSQAADDGAAPEILEPVDAEPDAADSDALAARTSTDASAEVAGRTRPNVQAGTAPATGADISAQAAAPAGIATPAQGGASTSTATPDEASASTSADADVAPADRGVAAAEQPPAASGGTPSTDANAPSEAEASPADPDAVAAGRPGTASGATTSAVPHAHPEADAQPEADAYRATAAPPNPPTGARSTPTGKTARKKGRGRSTNSAATAGSTTTPASAKSSAAKSSAAKSSAAAAAIAAESTSVTAAQRSRDTSAETSAPRKAGSRSESEGDSELAVAADSIPELASDSAKTPGEAGGVDVAGVGVDAGSATAPAAGAVTKPAAGSSTTTAGRAAEASSPTPAQINTAAPGGEDAVRADEKPADDAALIDGGSAEVPPGDQAIGAKAPITAQLAGADEPDGVVGVPLARQAKPSIGFPASSRPAWTPMPVQPRAAGSRGLTVLGTTLTVRQTVIALVVVLALVVGLVVAAIAAVGGDDKRNQAGPAATRAAATTPGPKPTTAAPTQVATTAPAPTTAAPSTAPPASAPVVTGGGGLPTGLSMYTDPTGFSVPIPTGATIERKGSEVYFSKDNRLLIVDQTDQPKPDPVADWKAQEADRAGRVYKDYQKIKIVPVSYFTKAADWEFTYTTGGGNPQHAVKRGVITSPNQAYGISWYTSPEDWAASQPYLQAIYQGFKPRS